jgi:uncharacterized integral membrane protein
MANYWENLSFWKKTKFIFTIILSVFVIIFAVINWRSASIDFVFINKDIPVTLVILVCLLVGYLIASLFESKHYNAKVREIEVLNNEVVALQADKNELKAQVHQLENEIESKANQSFDSPKFDSPEEEII